MSTTRKDAGSRIGLPNESTVSYFHPGHDIIVVLTVTAPSSQDGKFHSNSNRPKSSHYEHN
jgi:hypothetical protein